MQSIHTRHPKLSRSNAALLHLGAILGLGLTACTHLPPGPRPGDDAADTSRNEGSAALATDPTDPTMIAATSEGPQAMDGASTTGVLTSPVRGYLPLLPRRNAPRLELVAQLGGQAHGLAGAGDRLHYLRGGRIVTLDAAAPDEPREIAQSPALPHAATQLGTVADGALLLAYGERAAMLLDEGVAESGAPTLLAAVELPGRIEAFAADGRADRLWLAASEHGLLALDIADPRAPRVVGRLPARGETVDVTVRGTLAYVVDRKAGLLVVDIADPTAPRELGRFDDDGDARSLLLVGEHLAYVSTTHRFWVVDIADPRRPRKVWQPKELDGPEGPVEVRGGYRLSRTADRVLLHGHRLHVLDVADPERPRIGRFVPDESGDTWVAAGPLIEAAGAWWAGGGLGEDGTWELLRFEEVPSAGAPSTPPAASRGLVVVSRSRLPGPLAEWWPTILPGLRPGTLLYGRYALDIRDTRQVSRVGELGWGGAWSYALDPDRALVVASAAGSFSETLSVWDLHDPSTPRRMGTLTGRRDAWEDMPWYATEIALGDERAFVAGGWGGWGCPVFAVVDLADPSQPRELGFLDEEGDRDLYNYCRLAVSADASFVAGVDCGDRCDTSSEGGWGRLDLIDVSDPSTPVLAARARTEHEAYDVALEAGMAFVAVGPRGLEVFDVSEPKRPKRVGQLAVGDFLRWIEPIGDGHLVLGDRGALHVVDVREPERPQLVRSYRVPVRDELGGLALAEGHLWVGGREAGLLGYRVLR
jgi:hypothetical protein